MEDLRAQVKADCEELLMRFQQTQSVRFETFSSIWRDMNFSHIFYGVISRHEKRAFSRLVLDLAYPFFLPPFSFQIRVGGLYLLFSLYQNQSASPPEQVRVALKDWDEVKKLEKDAVDAQHYDVVYALRKMEACKAFSFTAMPQLLSYRKRRKFEPSALREQFMERTSRPQELINIELLEELSNVDKLYDKLKKSALSPALRGTGGPGVDLIQADLVPQLRGSVLDFYKWQLTQESSLKGEDSGEGTSSSQQSSRRAELLASIKSRAYGQAAEACKSRRHRQVELDLMSHVSGPSSSSRKQSLKARTRESLHGPGSVWAGDSSTTHISRLTSVKPEPSLHPGPGGRSQKNPAVQSESGQSPAVQLGTSWVHHLQASWGLPVAGRTSPAERTEQNSSVEDGGRDGGAPERHSSTEDLSGSQEAASSAPAVEASLERPDNEESAEPSAEGQRPPRQRRLPVWSQDYRMIPEN